MVRNCYLKLQGNEEYQNMKNNFKHNQDANANNCYNLYKDCTENLEAVQLYNMSQPPALRVHYNHYCDLKKRKIEEVISSKYAFTIHYS